MKPNTEKPRILFIFSDTGGGHRSASEAIIEALQLEFGGRYITARQIARPLVETIA